MRDYGKVHSSFWSSPTIAGLSEDARMLALYLITSPHSTIAGVFRLPDGYVCEDVQWSQERVAKGFAELLAKGFANRCATTKWVWVCKHFEWNQPENPNQRKSAAKIALSIPDECGWKLDFMRVCGAFLGIVDAPISNPSETVTKPFLNQEQEQEQEQEQDRNTPRRKSAAPCPDGVPDAVWQDFKKLRAAKKAPITETAMAGIAREADKAGLSLADALAMCCKRGWTGFDAAWVADKPSPSGGRNAEPAWRTEQRNRTRQVVPSIAEKPLPSQQNPNEFFDVEAKNVTAVALG